MSVAQRPDVSVVMSVYNGASALSQTIDSVLAQAGCTFEFVIVDDGSTDNTAELAKRLADGPTDALASTKHAINDATLTELENAFGREFEGQMTLLTGPGFAEGVTAFQEKRPANFRDL